MKKKIITSANKKKEANQREKEEILKRSSEEWESYVHLKCWVFGGKWYSHIM